MEKDHSEAIFFKISIWILQKLDNLFADFLP